jgi:serine/threonine protein kinase
MSRSTDNDPLLGRVLDGKYTLQSVLGRGGMGVVYRAYQSSLERAVALKLMRGLPEERRTDEREAEFQRRFFLEAATAAKLKHHNTITVFDYGSTTIDDERVLYITMELVDGITLSRLLKEQAPLPPLRAVNIGHQICRSLREAHAVGIVHRDLKPGNVMLIKDGGDGDADDGDLVKVLDFGLAKSRRAGSGTGLPQLTKAGTFLGSPRYVAPEQIEGRPVDGRADIYSWGCVMYRMLCGRVPFDGKQAVEVMWKHLKDPVPPLVRPDVSLPSRLVDLVLRCLAKEPAQRPASMDDVIADLKLVRTELGDSLSGKILRSTVTEAPAGPAPWLSPPTDDAAGTPSPQDKGPAATSTTTTAPPTGTMPARQTSSSASSSSSAPSWAETSSGDWQLQGHGEGSRPGMRPRRPASARWWTWPAAVSGMVLGLLVVGLFAAERSGLLETWLASTSPEPSDEPVVSAPVGVETRASAAATARLRIKTTPLGADVFEVTPQGLRLIGITPLTLPWDVVVGTPGREFLMQKRGFVPARARVAPPPPPPGGEPVWLDVEATLREAAPAQP